MELHNLLFIGMIFVIIGVILIIISSVGNSNAKIGVGGFIGPFAFGFGNGPELVKWVIVASIVIAVLFVVIALRQFG